MRKTEENKNQNDNSIFEITDEYKMMIDEMLLEEANSRARYVSLEEIKQRFNRNGLLGNK